MTQYSSLKTWFALGVLLLAPMALSACSCDGEVYSDMNPPPGEYEEIPVLNRQTEAWRPGYWALEDGQFVWVPGRILPRPSPTAMWKPARWTKHTFGWTFEPGYWQ